VGEAKQTRQDAKADSDRVEHDASSLELCRQFAPKFLALAKEVPEDEAALRCCEWVIALCRSHARDPELYQVEAAAWDMIKSNHAACDRLPAICLEAARVPSSAREEFLRALPNDYRQPVDVHAYAYLALADLLAKKAELKLGSDDRGEELLADQREYMAAIDLARLRRESAELYQHVLTHYADIPYTSDAQNEDECRTLGQLAARRLGELESQQLVRKTWPNVIEVPAEQFDHLSGN
jgi:hypothetical protein